MKKRNTWASVMLLRYGATYIFLLLIPLLILNIGMYNASKVISKNAIESNLMTLELNYKNIDSQINTMDFITTKTKVEGKLVGLNNIAADASLEDYYDIWAANKQINEYALLAASDMFIYYADNRIFLGTEHICRNLQNEYGKAYQFSDYTFEEFEEVFTTISLGRHFFQSMPMKFENTTRNGIIYARTLNPQTPSGKGSYIFFLIEDKYITDLFAPMLESGSMLMLLDHNSNMLFSTFAQDTPTELSDYLLSHQEYNGALPQNIFGSDNIATFSRSDSGLCYVLVTPRKIVFESVLALQFIVYILNIITIILAVFYIIIQVRRDGLRLLSVISPDQDKKMRGNIFDYVTNEFEFLNESNQNLSELIERQNNLIRNTAIDRLFNGSMLDEADFPKFMEQLDIPFTECAFCVLCFTLVEEQGFETDIEQLKVLNQEKQQMLRIVNDNFTHIGHIYSQSFNQIGVLCCFNDEEAPSYHEIITALVKRCMSQFFTISKSTFICAVTPLFDDINLVFIGYNQCREVLSRTTILDSEDRLIWTQEQPVGSLIMDYSLEMEGKLINQIKSGKGIEACETLLNIMEQNLTGDINPFDIFLMLNQIKLTLFKTLDGDFSPEIQKRCMRIDLIASSKELKEHLKDLVMDISNCYESRKIKNRNSLLEHIIEYINQNFDNPELSLKHMSAQFQLSETYFSQVFKDLTGENFSNYLQMLRMKEADKYIKGGNLKIEEIALLCGYSSTATFRRAYKRYYGIPPSQKRDKDW